MDAARLNLHRYFTSQVIREYGAELLERFVLASMADAEWAQRLSIELKRRGQTTRAVVKRATFAGVRQCKTKLVAQYRVLVHFPDGALEECVVEALPRCPDSAL